MSELEVRTLRVLWLPSLQIPDMHPLHWLCVIVVCITFKTMELVHSAAKGATTPYLQATSKPWPWLLSPLWLIMNKMTFPPCEDLRVTFCLLEANWKLLLSWNTDRFLLCLPLRLIRCLYSKWFHPILHKDSKVISPTHCCFLQLHTDHLGINLLGLNHSRPTISIEYDAICSVSIYSI